MTRAERFLIGWCFVFGAGTIALCAVEFVRAVQR
jgi:threonine dehydrogenase-like Zn-dependent dehydrogenase